MRAETTSTQIGEVVPAKTMTTLSINGRSCAGLLAIQPGVIPLTTRQSDSIIMDDHLFRLVQDSCAINMIDYFRNGAVVNCVNG